jgi:hypothetical protein
MQGLGKLKMRINGPEHRFDAMTSFPVWSFWALPKYHVLLSLLENYLVHQKFPKKSCSF